MQVSIGRSFGMSIFFQYGCFWKGGKTYVTQSTVEGSNGEIRGAISIKNNDRL